MKALDLLATEENIYTTLIDDAIGRNADVFSFVSLLNSLDSGNVIALNARWGEGKTFFVKQTKLVLETFNPHYEKIKHREEIQKTWEKLRKKQEIEIQPFVTVYYDAWKNGKRCFEFIEGRKSIRKDKKGKRLRSEDSGIF